MSLKKRSVAANAAISVVLDTVRLRAVEKHAAIRGKSVEAVFEQLRTIGEAAIVEAIDELAEFNGVFDSAMEEQARATLAKLDRELKPGKVESALSPTAVAS